MTPDEAPTRPLTWALPGHCLLALEHLPPGHPHLPSQTLAAQPPWCMHPVRPAHMTGPMRWSPCACTRARALQPPGLRCAEAAPPPAPANVEVRVRMAHVKPSWLLGVHNRCVLSVHPSLHTDTILAQRWIAHDAHRQTHSRTLLNMRSRWCMSAGASSHGLSRPAM